MGIATSVTLFPLLFFNMQYSLMPHLSLSQQMPWLGLLLAAYPLGQFFGMAILGDLSDHYGRRRLLLISLFGTCLGFLFTAFSVMEKDYRALLLCRWLTGLFAGNVAIAQASLSDLSENIITKGRYISLSQMVMGSAYIIGPIGGALLSNADISSGLSPTIPFYVFTIVLLILWSITQRFFNETLLQKINPSAFSLKNCVRHIQNAFLEKTLHHDFCMWVLFIAGWWLFESYLPSFLWQHFHFSTTQISVVLSGNGLLYAVFQYAIIQRFSDYLLQSYCYRLAMLFAGVAVMSLPYLHTTPHLVISMSVFVIGMGFAIPGLIQRISNKSPAEKQGNVMGILGSLQALSTVVVMILGGYCNALQPSLSIVIGGALLVMCSGLLKKSLSLPNQKLILRT